MHDSTIPEPCAIAISAPGTCRGPHSPRSCRTASTIRNMNLAAGVETLALGLGVSSAPGAYCPRRSRGHLSTPSISKRRFVMSALAVVATLASTGFVTAAPIAGDGLYQATRAQYWVAAMAAKPRVTTSRSVGRSASPLSAVPARPAAETVYKAPRAAWPPCLYCTRFVPLAPTVLGALGVSIPKRLKWAALGGHGRNGPGAPA